MSKDPIKINSDEFFNSIERLKELGVEGMISIPLENSKKELVLTFDAEYNGYKQGEKFVSVELRG